jgi:hypothetical protein
MALVGPIGASLQEAAGRRVDSTTPRTSLAARAAEGAGTASQERFELKYWVPERSTSTVASFAQSYLRSDSNQIESGQRVTSLYLDTPTRDFYRAHVAESPDRVKLRVRVYGDLRLGPAFFELKRKVKSVIVKRRAVVPLGEVAGILAGDYRALETLPQATDRQSLEAFLYFMTVQHAEPAVLVTCRREAYASTFEDDVRVTIDRDIAFQPAPPACFDSDPAAWTAVRSPAAVKGERMALVELKFRGLAPFWMERLVRSLEMQEVGFSKYVTSVDHEVAEAARQPFLTSSLWI